MTEKTPAEIEKRRMTYNQIQLKEELDKWVEVGILRKVKGDKYTETIFGKKIREKKVDLFFKGEILGIIDYWLKKNKYPSHNPIRKLVESLKEKSEVEK